MTTAASLPPASEPSAPAPSPPQPVPSPPEPAPWGLAWRIAFRFVFAYVVLYAFPYPLDAVGGLEFISNAFQAFWETVVPWVGKHVLGMEKDVTAMTTGSGDTTFNYVLFLVHLVLAAGVTAVWSVVDRRRTRYVKAYDLLRVYVRYMLALTMVSYGFAKVFKTQFPFPSPERLVQPLGEFSPMGLLWTFMGYSPGYNLFTGGAEVLGGVLLLFRRTTSLGALVVIAVMVNVVALNFFYDVPVKLYSSHLVLLAVFLLLPDVRRLLDVLLFNRPTLPVEQRTPFRLSRREAWGVLALKTLFLGVVLWNYVEARVEHVARNGDSAPKPPLHGLYEVESFTRDGQVLPPLVGDTTRWRYVGVNRYSRASVRLMDGTVKRFFLTQDAAKGTVTFTEGTGEQAKKSELTSSKPDAEHWVLQGPFQEGTVEIRLKKVDESSHLLISRGFNWIQEAPFNR
ncbi:DoxX family membrane protein [Pyxidicoccus fallax]|uniref:Membrane protein n=1 Tax=Pyxidicoccus fallax TaxID=394095 RepID=A0A3S5GXV9_9BACT|nr:DoxX family membrane protein [Pyxidicoccus fallax]AYM54028.1 membrane protein [Pyxidicoccus fallax]NMO20405.1 DoxX family membrane protein [Pyxidicoccus fallax]NPC85425.1 DoxX family membrane protein [Pyxidicoccus fallax]